MKQPKRYTCGNGEGMFDDKKGYWITYEEHLEIVNKLKEDINYNHCCKRDSEQLCDCDAPLIRTSGKRGEYCGICQKDLD